MRKLSAFATLIAFLFLFSSKVNANLDETIFVIKAVWPSNGQTNVPIDLKCAMAGCTYSNSTGIGSIAIGYGTDLEGGCGSPANCPEIPDINMSSVSSSTITISSPNDTSVTIRAGNNGTCYGQCFSNDGFYYNFSLIPSARLKPNTFYTVTIKGGSGGISAHRTVNGSEKDVYLPNDYSWSFTTGDANSAAPIEPTSTPRNTPTIKQNTYIRTITSTLIPTLPNKPTVTPTSTKKRLSSPTPTSAQEFIVNETQTPIDSTPIVEVVKKESWWSNLKNFFQHLLNKFRKQVPVEEVAFIPSSKLPSPTITIADTPTPTATPTTKPKPKPTTITKPVSVISENILRTKFGINSPDLIASILNDNGKLESYEREYYNQLKGWPELNTTVIEQRIFIPAFNSTKTCQAAHIIEIKNAAINYENMKAKTSVLKTRGMIRPIIKEAYAMSLDEEIQKISQEINSAKEALNQLVVKYCR